MKHFRNSIFMAEDDILRAQIKMVTVTHLIEDLLPKTEGRQNMMIGEIHGMIKDADKELSTAITELDEIARDMDD